MSNLDAQIKVALAEFIRDNYRLDVAEVTHWEDTTISEGWCETCYYETAGVKVTYLDSKGKSQGWTYRDSFASLVSSL